jgi:hypothetical protein
MKRKVMRFCEFGESRACAGEGTEVVAWPLGRRSRYCAHHARMHREVVAEVIEEMRAREVAEARR